MPSENTTGVRRYTSPPGGGATDIINIKKSINSIEDRLNCVIINKKITEYQTLITEYHKLMSNANNELTISEDKLNEINTCKDEIKTLVWSSELLKCVCTIIKFNLL